MPQVHLRAYQSIGSLGWNLFFGAVLRGTESLASGLGSAGLSGIQSFILLCASLRSDDAGLLFELCERYSVYPPGRPAWLEPVTARNWKTILGVLHFWRCGVPE